MVGTRLLLAPVVECFFLMLAVAGGHGVDGITDGGEVWGQRREP